MQSATTRNRATRSSRYNRLPPRDQGWSYSPLLLLLVGGIAFFLISTVAFYASWDQMPERVQYIPRAIEARFFPTTPTDEFVAAPSEAVAPEDALELFSLETLTGAPATRSESPTPNDTAEQAPAATNNSTEAPVAEAEVSADVPAESVPAQEAAPMATLHQPAAPSVQLQGIRHEFQGWNNCGPATLAMSLSYFGRNDTQRQTAPFLKPDSDDKNVSPNEMVAYAQSTGYDGQVIVGADLDLLRTLVTNNIPVIVETWYVPEPNDEMGHYLLLTGYEGEQLKFFDSYKGPDVVKDATEFDQFWKVFNRTAVVVWPPEQGELVASVLGQRTDQAAMYEHALQVAHDEVNANPQDKFAWFNLGSTLTALGQFDSAVQAFNTSRSLQLPWRMLWYQFGPYQAYFESGNYNEVVNLANATLSNATNLEESYYWRGKALAATERTEEARRDFQQALRLNPNFAPAQEALAALP